MGHSPWDHKESNMTEQLILNVFLLGCGKPRFAKLARSSFIGKIFKMLPKLPYNSSQMICEPEEFSMPVGHNKWYTERK